MEQARSVKSGRACSDTGPAGEPALITVQVTPECSYRSPAERGQILPGRDNALYQHSANDTGFRG